MAQSQNVIVRFVGKIKDLSEPYKYQLESYTVRQFLADLDSRISSLKITSDAAKIKEALILVHPEKGDAKEILLSPFFTDEVKTYADFKAKCLSIWEDQEHKNKFVNLQRMLSVKPTCTSMQFAVRTRIAMDRVLEDIFQSGCITKIDGGPRNQMVDAREMLTYVTYSNWFESLTDDYKQAFQKIELDPAQDHATLMIRLEAKIAESKIRKETNEIVAVTQPTDGPSSGRELSSQGQGQGQGSSIQGNYQNVGRGSFREVNSPRNTYVQNQSQRNYSRTYGRGQGPKSTHVQRNVVCQKCGRNNHRTNECRQCDKCKRIGHFASECYFRGRDNTTPTRNSPRGQGQQNPSRTQTSQN